ncbi:serine/threonine-protein kinase [Streptomonospora salina]|uniref:Protein kinase domain-containing protein n=1 Tax=Streptomonospora salina TaxID=104205 RepID=A0A841E8P2_9ACTN|nr:serine/threonine-protein kinase [Streptomonospora salina]MBB5999292.1 hypothetical protein [Streptomonospora salina]
MTLTSVFTTGPVPDRLTPLSGDDPRVIGPYRIAGRIGSGGMGAVYAAVDGSGACVAVKVVHSEHAADPDYRARFAREVDLLTRVRGACTAGVRAADTAGGTPWLATEYVPGKTLREHVHDEGPLGQGMLLALAAGIAEALVAVHGAGIVHRDLKPGNVILSPDGPKVLDFGIARAGDETAVTATGVLVGTPGWIPPEVYRGAEPDSRADMFAWGGLIAFAAAGRNPYGTAAPDILAFRAMEERPDLDGVPADLLPLVERAMSADPAQRPAAAEALRAVGGLWERRRAGPAAAGDGAEDGAAAGGEPALTRLLETEWTGVLPPAAARPATGVPKALVALAAAVSLVIAVTVGYVARGVVAEDRSWITGEVSAGGGTAEGRDAQGGPADTGGGGGGQGGAESADGTAGAGDDGRSATNGPYVTAVDGDDTFVLTNEGRVTWTIQLIGAAAADDGVRFTAIAGYQGVRAAQLVAEQFAVSSGGRDYPARDENLTNYLDAFQASDTVSFSVPGAPDTGRLSVRGAQYTEGGPGAPPMSVCYEVADGFSADTERCG